MTSSPGTLYREADLTVRMPAEAESVSVLRQTIAGVGDALGWSTPMINDLKVATGEALSNAVMHAYKGSIQGDVQVDVWVNSKTLHVRVRDYGSGMTPTVDASEGLGLGIPLIAAVCAEVSVRSADGGGTEVTMAFERLPEAVNE